MATFHDRPDCLAGPILKEPHFMTVKGAPDIVVGRCSHALWHGHQIPIEARKDILAANQQLSERGLRVLAFAARDLDDKAISAAIGDPNGIRAESGPRRAGRDHRSAPQRGQGRRPRRVRCRYRRPHDHRRSHGHRRGDRRSARARPGRPHRNRATAPAQTRSCSNGSRPCTCSGASRQRTRLRLAN